MKKVWILICLLLIIVGVIFFIVLGDNSKKEININDIGKKLDNPNHDILIPTKYDVKNVYLHNDDFVSAWAEIIMSNKIEISIYTSDDLKNKSSKYINKEKVNNTNIKEYKTNAGKREYIFKKDKLIYVYKFSPSEKENINQYLKTNLD
ncbi:hypothetical protein PVE99_30345 [Priestia megaterium]|uniref:DUF4367 domain-containing protein n=1 Tax=Priestia megaterium TaxID=1404 RepID=A0ABD4X2F3_PRIMG|nr:hypothetical protein [Priestia megaterium]MDD9786661.1 hypothetical protein [Priestia megaterium]